MSLGLRDLFPLWSPSRILFEDEHLLAVDKPPHCPTHGDGSDAPHAVVDRLRAWLRSRGEPDQLGIHQRLDIGTSGVLVFSRSKTASASLAAQFEQRKVEKRYVAIAAVGAGLRAPTTLRHRIEKGSSGSMIATEPRGDKQIAVTRVTRLEPISRGLARLELVPTTGRTHQIRCQLAKVGAPIAGDARYGGPFARRLLLHASELHLVHPATGDALALRAPVPFAFSIEELGADALSLPSDKERLRTRLLEAAERRSELGLRTDTDCFCLAFEEADGLGGVTVDRYGDHAVLSLRTDEALAMEDAIADALVELGAKAVYVKRRPRQASRIVDARDNQYAPADPVRGAPHPEPLWVRELDLRFRARLGDGLSTGVFLDQRHNRQRVRHLAKGKRVLNLFAYTGTFSAAAVAGGAAASTTLDISRTVLTWAREHLDAAGADPDVHVTIRADALVWLKKLPASQRFDVCVLDPPSFSTTKTSRFSAKRDYKKLASLALTALAQGGVLLACTNHRQIDERAFRRILESAAADAGRPLERLVSLSPPVDFPPLPTGPHLKAVLAELR